MLFRIFYLAISLMGLYITGVKPREAWITGGIQGIKNAYRAASFIRLNRQDFTPPRSTRDHSLMIYMYLFYLW